MDRYRRSRGVDRVQVHGYGQRGLLANIIVGVIGAFIGGFVMNALGGQGLTGFSIWSFVVALVGSIILLWILKVVRK